jgi:hypothetical protein
MCICLDKPPVGSAAWVGWVVVPVDEVVARAHQGWRFVCRCLHVVRETIAGKAMLPRQQLKFNV